MNTLLRRLLRRLASPYLFIEIWDRWRGMGSFLLLVHEWYTVRRAFWKFLQKRSLVEDAEEHWPLWTIRLQVPQTFPVILRWPDLVVFINGLCKSNMLRWAHRRPYPYISSGLGNTHSYLFYQGPPFFFCFRRLLFRRCLGKQRNFNHRLAF